MKFRILLGAAVMVALAGIVNFMPRKYGDFANYLSTAMLVAVAATTVHQAYCIAGWAMKDKPSWNGFSMGFSVTGIAVIVFNIFSWLYP